MTRRNICATLTAALGLCLGSLVARADDPSKAHVVYPDSLAAPGPIAAMPALHEGLQLTFSTLTTTTPGNVEQVIGAMHGTLEDPDSGWTFFTKDRQFFGAEGPLQITVSRIDGDNVISAFETFLSRSAAYRLDAPPASAGRFSGVQAVSGNTLIDGQWLTPAQLDQLAKAPPQGWQFSHGPYKDGDHTFDALIFSLSQPSLHCFLVYDAQTGFLVRRGIVSQGPPSLNVLPGVVPRGDVYCRFMDLVAVRDLKVPWANEPMPDWVGQTKMLHLSGNKTAESTNPPIRFPVTPWALNMSFTQGGNGWAHTITTIDVNGTHTTDKLDESWGSAQFGGLWAGPAVLAALQVGQVLDQDPVTGMKTEVVFVNDRSVSISEHNITGQQDWNYDKSTGMLLGRRVIGRVQLPTPRTDIEVEHLSGKE